MNHNPFMKNKFQGPRPAGEKFLPVNPDAGLRGFTLVEMLVATFVMVIILYMTLQITNYTNSLFMSTRKRIDTFQEARAGFEVMTRKISQAMLNTYWDYVGTIGSSTNVPRPPPNAANYTAASGSWQPTGYLRNSQLHFVCGQAQVTATGTGATALGNSVSSMTNPVVKIVGQAIFFQAPLGYTDVATPALNDLPNLLNPCGYFLEFSSDNPDRPAFLTGTEPGVASVGSDALPVKFRFRLKEFNLPAEYNYVYQYTSGSGQEKVGSTGFQYNNWWYGYPLTKHANSLASPLPFSAKYTLAQNVIALVFEPMRSPNDTVPTGAPEELAPLYFYDTRSWDQPLVQTTPQSIASRNQLPPQVMVTMVAIDEPSAARMQLLYGGANGSTIPTFSDASTPNSKLSGGLYSTTGVAQIFLYASTNSSTTGLPNPPQATSGPGSINYQYGQDLNNLEQALTNLHITFRVFSTNVTILQAKFSD